MDIEQNAGGIYTRYILYIYIHSTLAVLAVSYTYYIIVNLITRAYFLGLKHVQSIYSNKNITKVVLKII
jgi:hypothetical protein